MVESLTTGEWQNLPELLCPPTAALPAFDVWNLSRNWNGFYVSTSAAIYGEKLNRGKT
jgi:hypothetical protein